MNALSEIVRETTKDVTYIGIKIEDYTIWERRTPITPNDVAEICSKDDSIKFIVQPSKKRIFSDSEYQQAGAIISEDLSKCSLILGIKRPKNTKSLLPNKNYFFFGHVVKAQKENMGMLDYMLKQKIRFFDLECISNERGKRILQFGKFGGIAGTIDFMAGLGQFVLQKGFSTPLLNIAYSYKYFSIIDAYDHLQAVSKEIINKKLPESICPLIFAVTGKGGAAEGVWEVLHNLPIKVISPNQIEGLVKDKANPAHRQQIYVTTIEMQHMVRKIYTKNKKERSDPRVFNDQDYKQNPHKYESIFATKYLPYISVLFNCMYWDQRYPRLIENEHLRKLGQDQNLRLLGVCDISCDLRGAIELLNYFTNPDNPFFIYDVLEGKKENIIKYKDNNILYSACDSLPQLLPLDTSIYCSQVLKKYITSIAQTSLSTPFDQISLPSVVKNAMITNQGQMTPKYKYVTQRNSIKSHHLNSVIPYQSLKISGHLFDSTSINDIIQLLGHYPINFLFTDSFIGNSEEEPSHIILKLQSDVGDEIFNLVKEEIITICTKNKCKVQEIKEPLGESTIKTKL